jgi:beta-lactamase class D
VIEVFEIFAVVGVVLMFVGVAWKYRAGYGISILVPFHCPDPENQRSKNWVWLKQYWEQQLPGAEIIMGEDSISMNDSSVPFSKSVAVNDAASKASGDIFVIVDADGYFSSEAALLCAKKIRKARKKKQRLWFVPYRQFYRLTPEAAQNVLNSSPKDPYQFRLPMVQEDIQNASGISLGHWYGAGIQIMPREAFLEVGQLRNSLVHQNYAEFLLDKSADDIRLLCESVVTFRFVAIDPDQRAKMFWEYRHIEAYEVVASALKWDGTKYSRDAWNHDQTATTWMRDSVVWFSQRLTPQLGMAKVKDYLKRFDFGNGDISGGLTKAWLESSLAISPDEELRFWKRFWREGLPVSKHAFEMTKRITYVEASRSGWTLHGKTGSGSLPTGASGRSAPLWLGWFVGHVARGDREYVFVTSYSDRISSDDQRPPGWIAREIAMKILERLGAY